ncbi:hypothetical protein M8542_31505 [Amycolatopsis sp. OK19-0408]|uniref:Uncharacterized protein n=1 Tax=Amycolatopsis iheyensis TaxID=2945988 RepID=A0A9X2NEN7_9PSEU|nr:hypothetical protein [Amycolatopsis iheyensis]MCR6487366.1 hypothetical protein [Amycolatopsis iheyensis]
MSFALPRRVGLVVACGVLAVLGSAVPPSAAQETQPPAYTLKTVPADLSRVQDGDPLQVVVSGLPAGSVAVLKVCPTQLPDNLLKPDFSTGALQWVPDHDFGSRVRGYCAEEFSDELTGQRSGAHNVTRVRSRTSGDVVFDVSVPRGQSKPGFVGFDPKYTNFDKNANFPWADNPAVSPDGTIRTRSWSYSCDENTPCALTLEIVGADAAGVPFDVFDTSRVFRPAAPGLAVRGCGGIGTQTLNASMPERFGRTAVAWNQLLCGPTGGEQPTTIVGETEDAGLKAFDTGGSDLVVTGSGGTLAPQAVRAREYVPVGLNAAVLAATGWSPTDADDNGSPLISQVTAPFSMTFDELARMLSQGGQNPDSAGRGGIFRDGSAFVTRNPALAKVEASPPSEFLNPVARAGADPTALFWGTTGEAGAGTVPAVLGGVLTKTAPAAWKFPNLKDVYGAAAGQSPGVIKDLGALDPTEKSQHNVDAKVGQLAVRKAVDSVMTGTSAACFGGCLNWVVTDLATARAYGWQPVALPNANGKFVEPTEASLQAAAASMKEGADGTLQPGTATDPAAYPLTFAEYVAAPVNPLVDANCALLKPKQEQLATVLRMASHGGQGALAPGLAPLTPALAGEAESRAAKVGTGTAVGACEERAAANNPPAAASTGGGTVPPAGSVGPAGSPAPATGPAPAAVPTQASVLAAKNLADAVAIPPFSGAGVLGALIPLLALLVLATLPSMTAYATAGRPAPRWLTVLVGRLRFGRAA